LKGSENPIVLGKGALRRQAMAAGNDDRGKKRSGWEENAEDTAPLAIVEAVSDGRSARMPQAHREAV
jgi:hypothetical protein